MYEYYITGYNLKKLNGELSNDEIGRVDHSPPDEIRVHILNDCELLAKNTTGIQKVSFEQKLPRYTFEAIPLLWKNKKIFCCSKCYSKKYLQNDFETYKAVEDKKIEEMAKILARRALGLPDSE